MSLALYSPQGMALSTTVVFLTRLMEGVEANCNLQSTTLEALFTGVGAVLPAILCVGSIVVALATIAGNARCFSCTAAKECDYKDPVARAHACVSNALFHHLRLVRQLLLLLLQPTFLLSPSISPSIERTVTHYDPTLIFPRLG